MAIVIRCGEILYIWKYNTIQYNNNYTAVHLCLPFFLSLSVSALCFAFYLSPSHMCHLWLPTPEPGYFFRKN